ncbi:ribonuclease T2-like protein [Coniella lustricola]|uniref:Ribonuclease T2-like n=1 Tax=Coniella lustricola TaxID=2025994 RepID=A0A2T3AB29_9PEZI|nr:ribonuclease T2-like protein [Coniella lustricola]
MTSSVVSTLLALAACAVPATSSYSSASTIFDLYKRQSTCATVVESCSTAAAAASTCCVNRPGGQLLQVQFWDTDPVEGPANSWGIHGLWPDECTGDYQEDCDTTREYTDITTLIEKYGTTDLLDFMNTYWNSDDETNEEFWEHEWATHGTCISTLDPTCYTDYETGIEAVDFFQIVVNLFQTLNTYETLYAAGIVPSNTKTYTLAEIVDAISASFGEDPVLLCDDDTISEIYYGFFVNGPLVNQDFVPAAVVGEDSTCPDTGIKYPVKSGATTTVATTATLTATSVPLPTSGDATTTATAETTSSTSTTSRKITLPGKTATTTSTAATSTSTSTSSVSGSGYWVAYYDGVETGCLISEGTWYVSGTCATYDLTTSGSGFTMTSSKGSCEVSDDELTCASGDSATTFTSVDGYLAYDGATTFYCDVVPSGSEQGYVWTDYGDYEVTFLWSPK